MRWKTERTNDFEEWWETLTGAEQRQALSAIEALERSGPRTGRPFADSVHGSLYPNMKELRANETIRIFFAFDPRRIGILLIGGDKAGKTRRFYRQTVSRADKIYGAHLRRIAKGQFEDEKG
jgi:hypothetical protein